MNNPLINILVRTSKRPIFFDNCYKSIQEQTYKNIRLIVSYDDDSTKEYLKGYTIDALKEFKRKEDWSQLKSEVFSDGYIAKPFPPNEYFNELMELVYPGYIIKLDDDNRFSTPFSLERIIKRIKDNLQMFFWRVQFPGHLIPGNQYFGKAPQCCQIDTAGFAFHSDFIKFAVWDSYSCGDYRTAISLYHRIPQKIYINEVLVSLQKAPGHGLREDLEIIDPDNEI